MSKARRHGQRLAACLLANLVHAGLVGVTAGAAVAVTPVAASAQGLFDLFFGRTSRPEPSATAYADPSQPFGPADTKPAEPRVEAGPAVAYCVRLCDGRFFPIQRTAATPADVCNAFCPASRTKIFSGSSIEHAVAGDGSRYADLGNAYAFRDRIVPGCTCNGRDAFGLAHMQAADDPTLRPGDVVATESGFVSYTGGGRKHADFTPIDSSRGHRPEWRRQLAKTPIAPNPVPTSALPALKSHDAGDRQAQLSR